MRRREQQESMKWSVWPQYLVEPQYIEGYFEGLCSVSSNVLNNRWKWGGWYLQYIRQLQNRPEAQDHGPFNEAFKLPDVPGPRVIMQCLHRLLPDRRDLFTQFPGITLYEGSMRSREEVRAFFSLTFDLFSICRTRSFEMAYCLPRSSNVLGFSAMMRCCVI